ncbi:MAG: hypothetical protein HUK25_03215 [Treponema sp.]|nr:hypothetical protein [Treponema sp.]
MIFVVLSLVFLSTIRYSPDFKRKTIDYITMITSTINLYIFSLIDISLFPIFAVEFILASLSVVFKKNYFHFIILILFEIPFVPYLFQFLYNSDVSQISESLMNNIFLPFAIFLIIIPQYLTVFRILKGTSFFFYKKTKNPAMKDLGNLLLIAIFCVIFEAVIIFLLPENFSKTKKTNPSKIINKSPEKILKIETKTRHIFGDRIRTLKIDSDKPLEYCIIRVEGKDSTPVLFSENDYYAENATVCIFKTPFEPPSKMEFNYGEGKTETNITVTAIYEENGNIYMDYYSVIQEDF